MLQQLHPHFTGGPRPAGILLHQHKVGVMAVQGIHRAMRQVLWLVGSGLIHLEMQGDVAVAALLFFGLSLCVCLCVCVFVCVCVCV